MKTLTLILLLSISMPPQKTGYIIVITTKKSTVIKTQDIEKVYVYAEKIFPDNNINFRKELKKSSFVEIRTNNKSLYIEKKRINKRGKYRKL